MAMPSRHVFQFGDSLQRHIPKKQLKQRSFSPVALATGHVLNEKFMGGDVLKK